MDFAEAQDTAAFVVRENASFPPGERTPIPATTIFAESGVWDETIRAELMTYLAVNGYHGDIVDLRHYRPPVAVMLTNPHPSYHNDMREVHIVSHPEPLKAMAFARSQLRDYWGSVDEHGRCPAGWRITYMSDLSRQSARSFVTLPYMKNSQRFIPDYTVSLEELDAMIDRGEHIVDDTIKCEWVGSYASSEFFSRWERNDHA